MFRWRTVTKYTSLGEGTLDGGSLGGGSEREGSQLHAAESSCQVHAYSGMYGQGQNDVWVQTMSRSI